MTASVPMAEEELKIKGAAEQSKQLQEAEETEQVCSGRKTMLTTSATRHYVATALAQSILEDAGMIIVFRPG